MKISMNSIGNYNPYKINNSKNQINKTNNIKDVKNVTEINQSEKIFFKSMYPQNEKEINNYHFYEPTGKLSGVSLGSLFDKRG